MGGLSGSWAGRTLRMAGGGHIAATPPPRSKATNSISAHCQLAHGTCDRPAQTLATTMAIPLATTVNRRWPGVESYSIPDQPASSRPIAPPIEQYTGLYVFNRYNQISLERSMRSEEHTSELQSLM